MDNIEKRVNKEYLYVLDRIKELNLKTPKGRPLTYKINPLFVAPGIPSNEDQRLILEKLEEEGAIRIINSYGNNSCR